MSEKKKYTPTKESITKFDKVIFLIELDGMSLRTACKEIGFSRKVFLDIVNNDVERSNQYARAREERHELLLEQIIEIADTIPPKDSITAVQRSKVRMEARQWALSKMNPKKFGNKLEVEQNTEQRIVIEMDLGEDPKKND